MDQSFSQRTELIPGKLFQIFFSPKDEENCRKICFIKKKSYLCTRNHEMIATISRSGAVVARWAHNPKVVSSSLASATKKPSVLQDRRLFFFTFPKFY